MSQAADYNLSPYEARSDDGRVFAVGFVGALGVHLVFGIVLFAPFMEGFREWLISKEPAEQLVMTADGKPKEPEKKKSLEESGKDHLQTREMLKRTLMAPPKLKAAQPDEIRLGQDNGTDAPTVAWISYDSYQELIARQGKVLQPGQQSVMNPVEGAEMIANPVLGEGQPQPEGGSGMVAMAPTPPVPVLARPVQPAQEVPSPQGKTLVPTPSPESPSVAAAKPVESVEEKKAPPTVKPAEPIPVKAMPQEVKEQPAPVKPAQQVSEKSPEPAEPKKTAPEAAEASLGNKGEKPDASKDASRDVDTKVAVKPEASPKPQAGPGEAGLAKDLAAGRTTDRVSLDKGPGIGPDQTAMLEPGKAKVDGIARTPDEGHVEGVNKPATDPAHSTGKTGSETKEQAREATQGVKEAKGENQPTTKPTEQASAQTPAPVDPTALAIARMPDAPQEAGPAPTPKQATPAPSQGQAQAQPATPSQGAGQPGSKPGAAGPQGIPNSKEKPRETSAPKTDRDSAPVSLTGDSTLKVQPGRVITGKGIEIKTFHPEFSIVAMISSVPSNPTCRVVFAKDGSVDSAEILRSSGYPNIDGPILSSLYRWEATGEELKKLNRPFSLTIEVILGGSE
jgi:hypothetical protein